MSIEEFAEKLIRAMNEAWDNGNFDLLEKLEDPDVVYHLSSGQDGTGGFEGHKQFLTVTRQATSDRKIEWKYITGEGNLFALSYKSSSKVTGEIPGFPLPVGKRISGDTLFLFRLKDGRIVEAWEKGSTTVLD